MDSSLLKESLSQTLQWCPLLPGRVRYTNSAAKDRAGGVTMSDKPSDHGSIYLDNSGVRFTEILWPDGATIGEHVPAVDISSLVGHGKEGPQGLLCDIPHPLDQMSGIEPVMTVKVNKFSDGWALGVSLSHAVADASSFFDVVSKWSALARQMHLGRSSSLAFQLPGPGGGGGVGQHSASCVWDRNWIFEVDERTTWKTAVERLQLSGLENMAHKADAISRKVVARLIEKSVRKACDPQAVPGRLVVYFPTEELAAIKAAAQAGCKDLAAGTPNLSISTNDALCAHIAQCISQFLKYSGKTAISTTVQLRQRMPISSMAARKPQTDSSPLSAEKKFDPAVEAVALLPQLYIGNPLMMVTAVTDSPPHNMALSEVTLAIRSSIASLDMADIETRMKVIDEALRHNILLQDFGGSSTAKHSIGFNSMQKVPAYEADFGGGRPTLCLPPALGTAGLVFPAPDGDGVVVFLTPERNPALAKRMAASKKWMAALHTYAVAI
mmetsp:Transcript_40855/g.115558  ORF Transcript_40855/g.115558 Transcript_40855/m.115558 type:complete len:496 (-) Transcript_40855:391-1878(-)